MSDHETFQWLCIFINSVFIAGITAAVMAIYERDKK